MIKKLLLSASLGIFLCILSEAQVRKFETGSVIINMGANATPGDASSVSINNSLKPYGLVYELIETYNTTVSWCINPNKSKDGADFIYKGEAFRGGPFVIAAENVNATVLARCAFWAATYSGLEYIITTQPFYASEFAEMNTVPLWGINIENDAITKGYLTNAGIPNEDVDPSSVNKVVDASDLDDCYDCFMIAHSDPSAASHASLYRYLQPTSQGGWGGWIWAGCHGVSVLENLSPMIPSKYATYVNNGNMSNWEFAPNIGSYTDRIGAYRTAGQASNRIDVKFDATLPAGSVIYFYAKNPSGSDKTITVQSSPDIQTGATFNAEGTVDIYADLNSFSFQKTTGASSGNNMTLTLANAADGIRIISNDDNISIDVVAYDAIARPYNFLADDMRHYKIAPKHGDGTPPYDTYYPEQPFMQYMGFSDGSHQGGSEQIYLPENNTEWRPTTLPAVMDPDHPDILTAGAGADPHKQAGAIVFGRAYGNMQWGGIMYEGGHILNNGTVDENVAAIRAYLNFSLLASVDNPKTLDNTTSIPSVYSTGNPTAIQANAPGATAYQWTCECNGVLEPASRFSPNATSQSVTYTPSPGLVPIGGKPIECTLKLVIQDGCGRNYSFPNIIEVYAAPPAPPVAVDDNATFYDYETFKVDFIDNDYDPNLQSFDYTIGTTSTSGEPGTWTDNSDGTVTFVPTSPPAPGFGSYTATREYYICRPGSTWPADDGVTCDDATITITVNENTCPAGQVLVMVTKNATAATSGGNGWQNPANAVGGSSFCFNRAKNKQNGYAGNLDLTLDGGVDPLVPAGTVITVWWEGSDNSSGLRISSSPDNGSTFSTPVTTALGKTGGACVSATFTVPTGGANLLRIQGNKKDKDFVDYIEYEVLDCGDAAPAAEDGVVTMELNSPPVTIDFDDYVTHPDNDIDWTSFSTSIGPFSGTLGTYNSTDHTITYQPNSGFSGIDFFDYTFCDNNGDCASASITPIVQAPPIAVHDVNYTGDGGGTEGNVLTNDLTFNNNTFEITTVGDGTNPPVAIGAGVTFATTNGGSVTIAPDGEYDYTPPGSPYTGEDSFEYTICDDDGLCDVGVAVITVNDLVTTDNPPYATNDNTYIYKNNSTTIDALANDYDLDDDINTASYPVFWVGGAPNVSASIVTANGGTVVNNNDGTFDYTPATDFVGEDFFEYQICDINGVVQCDVARVNLNVSDKVLTVLNDLPNPLDDYYSTINGVKIVGENILANDFDVEDNDITVVSVDGTPLGSSPTGITNIPTTHGVVTVRPDGSFDFLPNQYFIGTEVLIYEMTDGVNRMEATIYIQMEFICGPGDNDGDGIANCDDLDNDNDGITDEEEGGIAFDSDGDGIPNAYDLDSDNDGIPDVKEAGGYDPDGDGIVGIGPLTFANGDVNSDGIPVEANSGTGYLLTDTDGDGLFNPYDIDADNDGIVDVIEGQHTFGYTPPSNMDIDNNGIDDAFDPNQGGSFIDPIDYDADGNPDYLDLDSDGDAGGLGGTDNAESYPSGYPNPAAGATDDSDGDGLLDFYDGYDATAPPGGVTGFNPNNANGAQTSGQTALNPFPLGTDASNAGPEPDWRDISIIYWDGTAWHNGQGTSGHPNTSDGAYSVYITDNEGEPATVARLEESAIIKNLVFLNDNNGSPQGLDINALVSNGDPGSGACLTVLGNVVNAGKVRMLSKTDAEYGQYLGPSLENAEFQMTMEEGWHTIGIPMGNATATSFQTDNPVGTVVLDQTASQNLFWYNSQKSSGEEHGFFKATNGGDYSTHAYGSWEHVLTSPDENLNTHAYNFYLDDKFGLPTVSPFTMIISVTGATNDYGKEIATHNNWGGWNLIPNIFPVTLDANSFDGQGNLFDPDDDGLYDFDRAIWIWNPNDAYQNPYPGKFTTGAYVAYDVENKTAVDGELVESPPLVAPMQAFYIRRIDGSQVRRNNATSVAPGGVSSGVAAGVLVDDALDDLVTQGVNEGKFINVLLKPDYRVACGTAAVPSTPHYKTVGTSDLLMIRVVDVADEELKDASELAFADHYTDGYDVGLDIAKISGGGNGAPTVFTIIEDKALVINKMGYPEDNTQVPVGFYAEENEKEYVFEGYKIPVGWTVYLEDKMTGAWHDLTLSGYTFKNNVNFQVERFVLHFNKTGDAIQPTDPNVIAWNVEQGIEVAFSNMVSESAEIMVTNLMGQVVYTTEAVPTNENHLIPIANDVVTVYMVTVITQELTVTHKVIR